jgi:ABC-2 type transport system permease protein
MLFLSGAFFPINGLPVWMNFLVIINPLTYSIDMFKKIILEADKLTPALRQAMGLNLTLFGHQINIFNEILFILMLSIIFVTLATIKFSHHN